MVEKGKEVVVAKGKKEDMSKAVKGAQIDETTVYLEDIQKPQYIPVCI
jgi:hypothetical protein